MKHRELKPGDPLIERGYQGKLTISVVQKVTPKTVVVMWAIKVADEYHTFGGANWVHSRNKGSPLYVMDREIVRKIEDLDVQISKLQGERGLLFQSLEKVEYE